MKYADERSPLMAISASSSRLAADNARAEGGISSKQTSNGGDTCDETSECIDSVHIPNGSPSITTTEREEVSGRGKNLLGAHFPDSILQGGDRGAPHLQGGGGSQFDLNEDAAYQRALRLNSEVETVRIYNEAQAENWDLNSEQGDTFSMDLGVSTMLHQPSLTK